MPKIKTEILGSNIEISFREDERKKLLNIIENFKKRVHEFKNFAGKVSDSKIIFLAALKAEDQIKDLQDLLNNKEKLINNHKNLLENQKYLYKEIDKLKSENNLLDKKNEDLERIQILAIEKIDLIEKKISNLLDNF